MSDSLNSIGDEMFEQSDSLSWLAGVSTPLSSNTTPTSDLLSNDWQAFMTYDDQSSAANLPLSFLLSSEATADAPSSFVSQTDLSPHSMAHQLSSTLPDPTDLTFAHNPASQHFTFTSPIIDTHTSPFSENSNRVSDDIDSRTSADLLAASNLARQLPSISPKSDSSLNSGARTKSPRVSGSKKLNVIASRTTPPSASRKRKQSDDEDAEEQQSQDEERPGVKKSAHNMIEKRYRNNLNDKIAALRDAVPSLRNVRRKSSDGDDNEAEDLEGLAPAHKLNKATVLSKATEYIRHLEKHKMRQEREINDLKSRLTNVERMIKSGTQAFHSPIATPNVALFQEDVFASASGLASSAQAPANGMIPIPDNIAHLRQSQVNQAPYGIPQAAYPIQDKTSGTSASTGTQRTVGISRNGLFGRVMLTGLTTIMLMEGLREEEPQGNEKEARGLFSFPVSILKFRGGDSAASGLDRITSMPLHDVFRLGLLFAAIAYILAPMFFSAQPQRKTRMTQVFKTPYSLASPIELRQKAWLTAVQTVWMPSHVFVSEVVALLLRTVQLGIIKVIGLSTYIFLTGNSKEHETARMKAWRTALDAQLSGGDADISSTRLLLTLLASGTVPSTPSRLMLRALHVRVLFWNATDLGSGVWQVLDAFSSRLARDCWVAAQTQYRLSSTKESDSSVDEDADLPEHLVKLLQLDAEEVLVDAVVERCYNLTYNVSTTDRNGVDDAMDSVKEDIHIASPLDALAAWWSTLAVNRILSGVIESTGHISTDLVDHSALAVDVAPPPSLARIRASVAKAVVTKQERESCIQDALAILPYPIRPSDTSEVSPAPSCVNLVAETPVPADIAATMAIIKCLALSESTSTKSHMLARAFINHYFSAHQAYTLLSFAAAMQLMQHYLDASRPQTMSSFSGLEKLSSSLRISIGSASGAKLGIDASIRAKAVKRCISANKRLTGVIEHDDCSDQGYASQEDSIVDDFAEAIH